MIGMLSLLIVPAVSLCTPGCPLASCCPPRAHCSWPSALTALASPTLWLLNPQPHHVCLCAPLSCCSAFGRHPLRSTSPSCPLVASATLALLLQLLPAELGLREGGRPITYCLVPLEIYGLQSWLDVQHCVAILSPVPHQLFLPLSLAVPLDLCHSH